MNNFIEQLNNIVKQYRMLDHPFYQEWNMGRLTHGSLREYAKQYYHFVQAFPTLVSATHANTPHLSVRQELLENLIEEERGDENHPGLWMRFGEALGVSEREAAKTEPLPETKTAIACLKSITRDRSFIEGVAALYAYESQIPEVARVKIDGLRKSYGVTDDRSLSFFTVHEEADVHHSGAERNILEQWAKTDREKQACLNAARDASWAMLTLLDGVYRAYVAPALN